MKSSAVLVLVILLNACSEGGEPAGVINAYDSEYSPAEIASLSSGVLSQKARDQKTKYMAYEHSLSIELEKSLMASVHTEIVSQCESDTEYGCVVLSSNLTAGDYQSSYISLRVKPKGIAYFSNIAGQKGEVSSQSTNAQDLSDSIRDNAKRSEMAINYRDKLLVLEAKESDDIDAMVKIASELSKVQSQLEFAQGERAKLFEKVEAELLNISITPPKTTGFWNPIGDSLESFGDDLAYGISNVISSSAVIIPWFIFLIILFLIVRLIFRLLRAKK